MIDLVEITITEFKKNIYPEYKKIFPSLERKPYHIIKKLVNKNFCTILKIVNNNETIGFFIINIVNNYVQIDYFAIFDKYQSKGYGTQALKTLQIKYQNSNGLFIEIEKIGLGTTDAENALRQRRYNFYSRLGFTALDFDLLLYGVIYTPCCYNFADINNKQLAINTIFDFYYLIRKKKIIDKFCKVI